LNQYYSKEIPVGFDRWFGLHGNSKYYNYTLNENGEIVNHKDSPEDYLTNVIKEKALEFITNQTVGKPFFAMLSVPSAHAPFTPENKYFDTLKSYSAPRTRNFNVGAKPFKKHWLMTMEPRTLPENVTEKIDEIYHRRLETLLSVDDLVEEIVLQLSKQHLIDETFIIFTSDHGYHLGQWAMPWDKRLPYETDIRIPLIVRGPNIPFDVVIKSPVMLIDLAPTILNWAKIPVDYRFIDGKPFDSLLINDTIEERQMLVEYWGEGNQETFNPECPWRRSQRLDGCTVESACKCYDSWNNTYSCVREFAKDKNFIFCIFEDHENYQEAYDLDNDFYQMENIGFEILPSIQAKYQIIVENLKSCRGDSCRIVK
jgi:N-acetylglucosamine-6-sulfatase